MYSGAISFSGYYQSGNTNKFYIEGKGDIKRASEDLEMIIAGTYGYGENRMKKEDNLFSGIFTADLFYQRRLSPFLLQVLEYNFAKGIDLRSQSGAGLKYVVIPASSNKTSISLALIYDKTNLFSKPGNYDNQNLRFSLRLKSKQELFDSRLILNAVAFYQPEVNDFSKRNVRFEGGIDMKITKRVFGVVNYIYSFDDVVSIGRKRADNKLTFGFRFGFGE